MNYMTKKKSYRFLKSKHKGHVIIWRYGVISLQNIELQRQM